MIGAAHRPIATGVTNPWGLAVRRPPPRSMAGTMRHYPPSSASTASSTAGRSGAGVAAVWRLGPQGRRRSRHNSSMHYRADYVDRLAAVGARSAPAGGQLAANSRALAGRAGAAPTSSPGVWRGRPPASSRTLGSTRSPPRAAARATLKVDGYGRGTTDAGDQTRSGRHVRAPGAAADAPRAGTLFVVTSRDPIYPDGSRLMPAWSMVPR